MQKSEIISGGGEDLRIPPLRCDSFSEITRCYWLQELPRNVDPNGLQHHKRTFRLRQRRRHQFRAARGDDFQSNVPRSRSHKLHMRREAAATRTVEHFTSNPVNNCISTARATGPFSSTVAPASGQSAYSSSDRPKQEMKCTQHPGRLK